MSPSIGFLWLMAAQLAFGLTNVAGQVELRPLPPELKTISDETGALTESEGKELALALHAVEVRTGAKIIIVLPHSTKPESIEHYSQRLVNSWQRNGDRLSSGHFVFVVMAPADREMRVTPSADLQSIAKDIKQGRFAVEGPALLRAGRYFDALMTLTAEISELVWSHDRR